MQRAADVFSRLVLPSIMSSTYSERPARIGESAGQLADLNVVGTTTAEAEWRRTQFSTIIPNDELQKALRCCEDVPRLCADRFVSVMAG